MTLTDFLLARIAEDEGAARMPHGAERWRQVEDAKERHLGLTLTFACPTCHQGPGETCIAMTPPTRAPQPALGLHSTRQALARASKQAMDWHARILAECEAKRRIVDMLSDSWDEPVDTRARWTLETLALPYADHPDYRPEWRP